MTVGTKIQQTLASAEGVKANLTSFALETNDQEAKQMYGQLAQSMESIVSSLKARASYVEQQEPQYKQQ
ncbi:DUF1657 domain-containing protein [Ammoniphilus sp. 3BR4]|uniref:DUF1657 domain-containing protein n=1 Tax=Ammoniphilus sp. 3BR4 TaxID=3158265 RepID=UPI0034661D96